MSIYIRGKQAELVAVYADDSPVIEIWAGDSLVWPDVTDCAGGIIIEQPAQDSADYRYWLHALSAIEDGDIGLTLYLKFEVDGVDYYINRAPRGKQRVVLEGNIIKLNARQQAALAGKVGQTVSVKAAIPERLAEWRKFPDYNSTENVHKSRWSLPLLEDSCFRLSAYKGQKREWAYNQIFHATTFPSNTEFEIGFNEGITSKGRYPYELTTAKLADIEPVNGDYITEVSYNLYGAARCDKGITIVYPAFERTFELNVVSTF